jgi:hypothetical protein
MRLRDASRLKDQKRMRGKATATYTRKVIEYLDELGNLISDPSPSSFDQLGRVSADALSFASQRVEIASAVCDAIEQGRDDWRRDFLDAQLRHHNETGELPRAVGNVMLPEGSENPSIHQTIRKDGRELHSFSFITEAPTDLAESGLICLCGARPLSCDVSEQGKRKYFCFCANPNCSIRVFHNKCLGLEKKCDYLNWICPLCLGRMKIG